MSGCPFFSSGKPQKQPFSHVPKPSTTDPAPFVILQKFSEPYLSPYSAQFSKFELSAQNPLLPLKFHYKNSLFHHPYVVKFRASDLNSRILMANELREGGNKSFNKGDYFKACLSYEHAFALFNYCELKENEVKIIQVPQTSEDFNEYRGIAIQILINYAYALDMLGNFKEAEILLHEAEEIWSTTNVKIAKIVGKLMNVESEFEDLIQFSGFLKSVRVKNEKFAELEKSFEQVIYKIQQKNCEFWAEFFKEYSSGAKTKPLCGFDLEFKVVNSLSDKYEKMLEYYQETDMFAKVLNEKREVQRVLIQMKKVKKVKIADEDEIMLAHAKAAGVSLDGPNSWVRFETAKRSLVSRIFNSGSFNKRLLYECIQVTMAEFEQKAEIQDKTDLELQFWQRNLVACVIFAVLAFFMASNPL